jgi:hypothetical protein
MRWLIVLIGLLLAAPAYAKTTNTECVTQDGSRFYMSASKGKVVVLWDGHGWNEAFGELKDDVLVITQIAPNGVIVIAWEYKNNAAYVVMKNDRTGERTESRARCWFK